MAETSSVRLTQTVSCAGCAAKLDPNMLSAALKGIAWPGDPRVLVGFDQCDDAAIYDLGGQLLVSTVDFFTPIVDDPEIYGAVAATNALSDVYAMGGEPLFALNIVHYPETLGPELLRGVLAGGARVCAEARCPIVGGHSVKAPEMTYGLAVTGRIRPGERYFANAGAQVGDALVLTKALGTGIMATTTKKALIAPDDHRALLASLLRLNRNAGDTMQRFPVHAATDITGFSLAGHGSELASASGVELRIDTRRLPLLPGLAQAIAAGCLTRGDKSNRLYAGDRAVVAASVDQVRNHAVFDPQSSGGLLIAVAPTHAEALVAALRSGGDEPATVIGEVAAGRTGITFSDAAQRDLLRAGLAACAMEAGSGDDPARLAATAAFAARMIARDDPPGAALALARRSWAGVLAAAAAHGAAPSLGVRAQLAECLLDAVQVGGAREHREAAASLLDQLRAGLAGAAHPDGAAGPGDAGLAIAALARGYGVLDDESCRAAALAAAASLGGAGDGGLAGGPGTPAAPARAMDCIGAIHGAVTLYQVLGEARWLKWAVALQDRLDRDFWDGTARTYRGVADAAPPRGAGLAALDLLGLAAITDDDGFGERGQALLDAALARLPAPAADPWLLCALDQRLGPDPHLIIVGDPAAAATRALSTAAHRGFQPRLAIVTHAGDPIQAELRGRFPGMVPSPMVDGKPTAYLCIGQMCYRPTTDPAALAKQLAAVPGR
jgi:selenide,water dikinase